MLTDNSCVSATDLASAKIANIGRATRLRRPSTRPGILSTMGIAIDEHVDLSATWQCTGAEVAGSAWKRQREANDSQQPAASSALELNWSGFSLKEST